MALPWNPSLRKQEKINSCRGKDQGRGFSDVDFLSVEMSCVHQTRFSPYSGFPVIYIEIVFLFVCFFYLKLGFKKRLSTQTIVFIIN